jgi:hypothetical protein
MGGGESWIPEADAQTIDDTIVKLAAQKGELEIEIGRWLLAAKRERVANKLGFGSFFEYVSRRIGWGPRTVEEKLRVAESLETLPKLQDLVRAGERSWSAVKEISRVATPENETAWIEKTEQKTVREIEQMVSGRERGDSPSDPKNPLLIKRRLVVELPAEIHALMTEALVSIRREQPGIAQEEMWRTVANIVLGHNTPADAEAPAFQVTVTRCVSCERTWMQAGCDAVEVPPSVGERAYCDGEIVGVTQIDEGIAAAGDTRAKPPAKGAHVDAPAAKDSRPETPAASSASATGVDGAAAREPKRDTSAASPAPRAHVGASPGKGPKLETPVESRAPGAHVGGPTSTSPAAAASLVETDRALVDCLERYIQHGGWRAVVNGVSRALGFELKSMTPRLKAIVRARDRRRCVVPGCRNQAVLEIHHLKPRWLGGPNIPMNLVCLCAAHHARIHEGRLAIEVSSEGELTFRHEDGAVYGGGKLERPPIPRSRPPARGDLTMEQVT